MTVCSRGSSIVNQDRDILLAAQPWRGLCNQSRWTRWVVTLTYMGPCSCMFCSGVRKRTLVLISRLGIFSIGPWPTAMELSASSPEREAQSVSLLIRFLPYRRAWQSCCVSQLNALMFNRPSNSLRLDNVRFRRGIVCAGRLLYWAGWAKSMIPQSSQLLSSPNQLPINLALHYPWYLV